MTEMIPVDHPGVYIREELEAREWTQRDLAYILGMTEQQLSPIIAGKRAVSPDMARMFGDAFGVPAEFFANLQKQYELSHAKEPDPGVRFRAEIQSVYPLREMIRRGWIEDSDSALLELQITRFFEAGSRAEVPKLGHNHAPVAFAAKRTHYDDDPAGQVAWLYRVRHLARTMQVQPYSQAKLEASLVKLRSLVINPEDISLVPGILAECGVRLVVVEWLPGTKIDGVCTWLDHSSPVIGLSTLHDRLDNFWFVLRHEIEHVLRGHGKSHAVLDSLEGEAATESENIAEDERQANAAAAAFCVSKQKVHSFIARKHPFYSERDIVGFAAVIEVHPAIVVGQIQYALQKYNFLRKYQVPIRRYLTATALHDGWGNVVGTNL